MFTFDVSHASLLLFTKLRGSLLLASRGEIHDVKSIFHQDSFQWERHRGQRYFASKRESLFIIVGGSPPRGVIKKLGRMYLWQLSETRDSSLIRNYTGDKCCKDEWTLPSRWINFPRVTCEWWMLHEPWERSRDCSNLVCLDFYSLSLISLPSFSLSLSLTSKNRNLPKQQPRPTRMCIIAS